MDYKLMIIDDEKDSVESLEIIIKEFFPYVDIIATSNNPVEGRLLIMEKKPEILLLDIQMPRMTGFELLETLPVKDFELIFITAFNQYAINAIKADAIDYLLKPFNINDVVKSIQKAIGNISLKRQIEIPVKVNVEGKISIPSMDGFDFIKISEIVYVKAEGSYCEIYTLDNKYVVSKSMKDVEEKLDKSIFFRSHKSYILNLNLIKKYNRDTQDVKMANGHNVPLSFRKKEEFIQFIRKNW